MYVIIHGCYEYLEMNPDDVYKAVVDNLKKGMIINISI